MRKSIYLLTSTSTSHNHRFHPHPPPANHIHRFHPLPLATPASYLPRPQVTPIHSTHSLKSNADSERVFSLVRRIKTDFRASLSTSSLLSLIGCHFNKTTSCCEFTKFPDSLQKAKTCTMERNRAIATVAEHD